MLNRSTGAMWKRVRPSDIVLWTCRNPLIQLSGRSIFFSLWPSPLSVLTVKPLGASAVQLGQAMLQFLDPGGGLLALEAEAVEELLVLLLQPGAELQAVARPILVIADDDVVQRRQGLAEQDRLRQVAAEVGRL